MILGDNLIRRLEIAEPYKRNPPLWTKSKIFEPAKAGFVFLQPFLGKSTTF
jgi:hypothetical protein